MIELVSTLVFGRDGNAEDGLGTGWSAGEDGHRWMIGPQSELSLRYDGPERDCLLEIVLHPYIHRPAHTRQRLVVTAGTVQLGEIDVRRPATLCFYLPAALLAAGHGANITFHHPDAVRPIDIGNGRDDRMLSLSASIGRLWRLPATCAEPATRNGSGYGGRSVPVSEPAATTLQSPVLVMHFESLGESQEFGLVQRLCHQEPIGLFGLATIDLQSLVRGLRSGFDGLGDAQRLKIIEKGGEAVVYDSLYSIAYRVGAGKDQTGDTGLLPRHAADLKLLADSLMRDIRQGSKIFVLVGNEPLTEPEVWSLFVSLNAYAANTLLWVVPAVEGRPPGTVERVAHGLLKGYIDCFAQPGAPDNVSLPVWLEICRNARSLVHELRDGLPMSSVSVNVASTTVGSRPVFKIEAMGDFASQDIAGIDFQCLARPSHALPASPRFIFGMFPAQLTSYYYRQFGLGSIGIHRARNVKLSGQFLLSRDETYFRCPEMNVHEAHIRGELDRLSAYATTTREKRLDGQYVVLAGPGNRVYGHWLIEYIPKIGLLSAAGYRVQDLNYLIPSSAQNYVFAWLELLGIGAERIFTYDSDREVVAADELLIPTVLHNGVRMSPLLQNAAAVLLDIIGSSHDLHGTAHRPHILLSRGTSQSRALLNRDAIEDLAVRAGFEIVQPEKLSLLEQVRLFHGARAIIAEYGSALHGSIFSPAGTVVCALRGTNPHPGFIQSGIGAILQQPTGFVFGESEGDGLNAGFLVDESTFKICIDLVFKPRLL